jgi:hypothetical protein
VSFLLNDWKIKTPNPGREGKFVPTVEQAFLTTKLMLARLI